MDFSDYKIQATENSENIDLARESPGSSQGLCGNKYRINETGHDACYRSYTRTYFKLHCYFTFQCSYFLRVKRQTSSLFLSFLVTHACDSVLLVMMFCMICTGSEVHWARTWMIDFLWTLLAMKHAPQPWTYNQTLTTEFSKKKTASSITNLQIDSSLLTTSLSKYKMDTYAK